MGRFKVEGIKDQIQVGGAIQRGRQLIGGTKLKLCKSRGKIKRFLGQPGYYRAAWKERFQIISARGGGVGQYARVGKVMRVEHLS